MATINNTFLAPAGLQGRPVDLPAVSNDDYVVSVYSVLGMREVEPAVLARWAAALALPEGSDGAETRESLPLSVVYSPYAGKAGLPGGELSVDNVFAAGQNLKFPNDIEIISRGSAAMQTEASHEHSVLTVIGMADQGFVVI